MKPFLTLLVLASLACAAPVNAQVMPGDRVRVTTVDNSRIVGRLARGDSLSLTIVTSEETRMAHAQQRTIDRRTIALIERRDGYNSKVKTGALVGLGVGLAAGVAVGFMAAMGEESGEPLITLPIAFGSMGMLGGAAIGAGVDDDRWTAVPFDARVGLQLGSASMPLALGIRASF